MKNISFKPWICIAVVMLLACCIGYASAYIEESKQTNQEIVNYLGDNTASVTTNNDVAVIRIVNEDGNPVFEVAYYFVYYGGKYANTVPFQEDFKRHVDMMIKEENNLSVEEEYTAVVVRADAVGTVGDLQLKYVGAWTQKDGFSFHYLDPTSVETETEVLVPTDAASEVSSG